MGQELSQFREIGPRFAEPSFDRRVSHFLFLKKWVFIVIEVNESSFLVANLRNTKTLK